MSPIGRPHSNAAPARAHWPSRLSALSLGGLLIVLVLLLAPVRAFAAEDEEAEDEASDPVERERVLVRVMPANKRVSSRLRAELDIIGLDAEPLELPRNSPLLGPDLLDELAQTDASAAIEIDINDQRVDVWVADTTTGKTLTRRFDLAIDPEHGKPRTLAIAAVELLRASRLEAKSELEGPAAAEQETELERPPRRVALDRVGSLSVGPSIGWSPGTPQNLGVTAHVELAGRWAVLEGFALRFAARVPVIGNGVTGTDDNGDLIGSARVFVSTLVVEPQWTPQIPRAAWLRPALGLGLGGAVTAIIGDPVDENVTRRTPILGGFVVGGHLDLGFAIQPRLWLHLDGNISVVQPAPRVLLVDQFVATFGLPWLSGGIALELWI